MDDSQPKESLELRRAFLNLTDQDVALLADMRPAIEAQAPSLVAAFYRHLLSFEPTRKFLADPDVKKRLLEKQREYMLSLVGPHLDEDYLTERRWIGETHARAGLKADWYLAAFGTYYELLVPVIREHLRHSPDRCERTVDALAKLLVLDAQLAVQAYIDRHEQQLEHLNTELAESSRALARDLNDRSAELRRTSRRAQAAENLASVATLVAGLAHEIGTPMGVIQGHAEALESGVEGEKNRWRLRTIREQIGRISKIIEALLGMARPHEFVLEPVELEPLLETTVSFLGVKLRRRQIEVERDFKAVPSIAGDAEKLQQLLLNLMLNAADAMQDGGGVLGLKLESVGEDRVQFTVSDSGEGIEAIELGRIFDPFFTTKPAGEGNGLGLVVAKGIVDDHGGEIEVSSEPDQGTKFRVRFQRWVGPASS